MAQSTVGHLRRKTIGNTVIINGDVLRRAVMELTIYGTGLTPWEEGFIDSVITKYESKGWLSVIQYEKFMQIYRDRCES